MLWPTHLDAHRSAVCVLLFGLVCGGIALLVVGSTGGGPPPPDRTARRRDVVDVGAHVAHLLGGVQMLAAAALLVPDLFRV